MTKKKRYVYRYVSTGRGYLRSRKRGRKIVKLFFCFILFVLVIFFVYFSGKRLIDIIYESDNMIVKDIEIVGTKNVTKAEIKELLPFKIRDNLLKINLSEAENEIKKLKPELKNIIISRRWQKVRIKLYERTPEAFIMYNDEMLGIDFDDSSFPLRGFMSTMKVPKLFYKSADERKELLRFIKRFKSVCGDFLDNISEIKFSNTGDIIFVMHDNTVVFWGIDERPEHLPHKFEKFQKVYVDAMSKYKQLKYIDMTLYSSGRAIVKPIVD
ncbi:MAG: FtsQ-type POTRA domain-containing protein [Endomicrobium sp.]|jgi:cell division protein FtsQ|nr:FtsQ-type POTRA domain-containing protein [Endomicrobium sp.]